MLRFLKGFFSKPTPPDTLAPVVPYKMEAPATDWPFPKATEVTPDPAPVVTTAPAKKPRTPGGVLRVPAEPAPAVKPAVAAKKPRARKTPAN